MRKLVFYSYKGGVGRTTLMVGLGANLAMQGHSVCMLDFDLEASSLVTLFRGEPRRIGNKELFHILLHANAKLTLDCMISLNDLLKRRFGSKNPPGKGHLCYLPTISDPELLDRVQFNKPLRFLIHEMVELIKEQGGIDVLLIDVRTGLSPAASLMFPIADQAVVVTRIDPQNAYGLSQIIPNMKEELLKPVLVANLLPGDSQRVTERLAWFSNKVGQPVDVCIGYDPEQVFDEDFEQAGKVDSEMYRGIQAMITHLNLRS